MVYRPKHDALLKHDASLEHTPHCNLRARALCDHHPPVPPSLPALFKQRWFLLLKFESVVWMLPSSVHLPNSHTTVLPRHLREDVEFV